MHPEALSRGGEGVRVLLRLFWSPGRLYQPIYERGGFSGALDKGSFSLHISGSSLVGYVMWVDSQTNIGKRSLAPRSGGGLIQRGQWHHVAMTHVNVGNRRWKLFLFIDDAGDGPISRWNATDRTWEITDGSTQQISVGPDGVPWIVQASRQIWTGTPEYFREAEATIHPG
jgi:hypothetical protein